MRFLKSGHITLLRTLCIGVLLSVLTTGCFKQKMVISVNPDGSGKILLSTVYSKEMVAMMEQQTKQMQAAMSQMNDDEAASDVDPFYNEMALRFIAQQLGLDVSLSTSRKYDKDGARGFLAVYDFKDINAIRISTQISMLAYMIPQMGMMGGSGMTEEQLFSSFEGMSSQMGMDSEVTFNLAKGNTNVLTVKLPEMEPAAKVEETAELTAETQMGSNMAAQQMMAMGNPFGFSGEETEAQMMQKMMDGMQLSLDIQVLADEVRAVAGVPRKGTSNRWVIYDIDFGKVAASQGGATTMQSFETMGGGGEMGISKFGAYRDFEGCIVQTNDLSISF